MAKARIAEITIVSLVTCAVHHIDHRSNDRQSNVVNEKLSLQALCSMKIIMERLAPHLYHFLPTSCSTKLRMGRLAPYTYHVRQASCSMKIKLGRLAPYMYHVLQPTCSTNMRMRRLDPYMFHVIVQIDRVGQLQRSFM